MINCFPLIYEDELLYSIVARYKRTCGIQGNQNLIRDLYNKKQGMMSVIFPIHIDSLVEKLPQGSKINPNKLLNENTMYPFYTKFLAESLSEEIKEGMLIKDRFNGVVKAGFIGSKVKLNKYLKYCPICIENDMKMLGESYWRREHQVIGVLFCKKHKIKLKDSTVVTGEINNKYICVDDIEIDKEIDSNGVEYLDYNLKYIKLVEELSNEAGKRMEQSVINRFYINELMKRKLASQNGNIYMKKLLLTFKEFYPQNYLKLMQCDFEVGDKNVWIRRFFSNNKNKSVVYHLLLLQFLKRSIKDLFSYAEDIQIDKKGKNHKPIYDLEEKRKQWLELIKSNPNKPRCELKKIGKGLHTYIYKYDKEWYNSVTPIYKRRKRVKEYVNWAERDEVILKKVKVAVSNILNKQGKPVKISALSIMKESWLNKQINNKKLIKTNEYINEAKETDNDYWRRKILWAIKELQNEEIPLTLYKIQIKSGFGNDSDGSKRKLIMDMLGNSFI